MSKKMLIDATHAEETRVVVVDGNKVEEFDFESENKRQLAGNIYLAKVSRVEPSLQAAFVEYGGNRHGFLAFSEIHPDYYQIPVADREALLAEERAYAAQDDDEEEEAPKPRRSRRRRSKAKDPKAEAVSSDDATDSREVTSDDIPGMGVVDLDTEDDAGPVDLAVVVVPKEVVPTVMADAAAKGVRGIIMITAGFKETGPEGARREDELMAVVREHGMRMVGPTAWGSSTPTRPSPSTPPSRPPCPHRAS